MDFQPSIIAGQLIDLPNGVPWQDGMCWEHAQTQNGKLGVFVAKGRFAQRFARAAADGGVSNLHVFPMHDQMMLVAFEEHGKVIAVNMSSAIAKILLVLIFLFGVATTPFFGAGLVLLFLWWGLFKRSRSSAHLDRYVRSLPAIERIDG